MSREKDTKPLAGKRALVCGSTRGIGRACALEFARLGARVTLLARDPEGLEAVKRDLIAPGGESAGTGHDAIRADFNDPAAVRSVLEEHLEKTGPYQILLNNTGGPRAGPILDAEPAAFQAAFSRLLVCSQILARLLVPGMRETRYGRIINIVSTSVKQSLPGLGVSNTVRGAVAAWAKTLASELAPHGITVNNVLPGATWTDRLRELIRDRARTAGRSEAEIERAMQSEIPAGRFAEPEEIAAAAGFLATPAAAYITGVSLPVDGGRTQAL